MPRAKEKVKKDRRKKGEGSIDVIIENKLYLLRWREPLPGDSNKTLRRTVRFHGTETEAYRELRRLQSMADAGKCKPRRITFQALAEEFLENRELMKHCRARTLERYSDNLRVHFIPVLGKYPIDQITSKMCLKLLLAKKSQNSRYGRPYSKSSVDGMHTDLKVVFNYAIKKDQDPYIDRNPAAAFVLPDGAPDAAPSREQISKELAAPVLTLSWRQKFIDAAVQDIFYIAFCIAMETGKRRGEVAALQWADINFETGVIWIYKSLQRLRNIGLNLGPLKGKKKGKKKVTFIVVGTAILGLLRQHRLNQQAIKNAMGERYNDEDFVFCHDDGCRYDPKTIYKHFKRICADLKIAESLTLHDLRHDYTTARIDRGDDIEDVSMDLDHESIATTWVYDHATYERKIKVALDTEAELRFPTPLWSGLHAIVSPEREQQI